MKTSVSALLVAAVLLAFAPTLAEGLPRTARITTAGLGKVKIGMTLRQVERAIKRDVVLESVSEGCGSARLAKGVSGLFTDRRLAVIYVRTKRHRTLSGIRRGDTEQEIYDTYPGKITTTKHEYVPGGHYLTYRDGKRRIVFETNKDQRVDLIRTGRLPEIRYIEGCA